MMDIMVDIIKDYSDTGKIDDIPADRRAEFIKEVQAEIAGEEGESED